MHHAYHNYPNSKVSWPSQSNIHKLKTVLLLILDYGFCFLCLFATLIITDPIFSAFFTLHGLCMYGNLNSIVGIGDVPESFLSSQSHEPFESESSKILSSHKNGRVTSSHCFTSSSQCPVIQISNFSYIFGYRSSSGPSVAIGPPVDIQ